MLPEEYYNELNEEDLWTEIEESYPHIKTIMGTMVGRFKAHAYNKGFQEGFKSGVSKGFLKGLDEGEQHQILKIVIKKIVAKFGAISFENYEKLRTLKEVELEIVLEKIDDFLEIEELRKCIGLSEERRL